MTINVARAKYTLFAVLAVMSVLVATASAGAFTQNQQLQPRNYRLHPIPLTTTVSGSNTGAIFEAINSGFTAFNTFGLEGIVSNAPGGIGVLGFGNNPTVGNYGVYGSVLGPNGTGVYGYAALPAPSGVTNTPSPSTLSAGLIGLSHTGFGLIGQADWPNSSNVLTNPIAAVEGVDQSSSGAVNLGVLGTTSNGGWGVAGESGTGALGGVFAYATNGIGLQAQSTSNVGILATSSSSDGVFAQSTSSDGVFSQSTSSFGLFGKSTSGYGALGETSTGPAGVEAFGDGVTTPTDPAGSGGQALYAENNSNRATIWGYQQGAGGMMDLQSTAHGIVLSVDNAGNMTILGTLHTAGSCSVGCAASRHVVEYTPRAAMPTMEDVGESQLLNGHAYVQLDPSFANVINTRASYLVFITAEGDSNGMYVTAKTPSGFYVHENRGGRSSVAFQYRIVAKPIDSNETRLPMVRTTNVQASPGRIPFAQHAEMQMTAKRAQFMAQLRAHPVPSQVKAPGPSQRIH